MILRFISCLIVIFGCGYVGNLYSNNYLIRVNQLEQFQNALKQLEFDISFLASPLYEAMDKVANGSTGTVKNIFRFAADALSERKVMKMSAVWDKAFKKYRYEIRITKSDMLILEEFSANLGSGDRDSEINNIKAALMRLKVAENEARGEAEKNVKMYRGFGFLLGIFIVVVLF